MTLPQRNQAAETAFLKELNQASSSLIEEAIDCSIKARRPKLAGQIFLLLDQQEPLSPTLRKANKALGFLIVEKRGWEEVEELWERHQRSTRINRLHSRHRSPQDPRSRPWKRK
jgi:hypothetical protein